MSDNRNIAHLQKSPHLLERLAFYAVQASFTDPTLFSAAQTDAHLVLELSQLIAQGKLDETELWDEMWL